MELLVLIIFVGLVVLSMKKHAHAWALKQYKTADLEDLKVKSKLWEELDF